MSFATPLAARITRLPRAFEPEQGRAAATLVPEALGALVAGAAGSSPFLAGLVARESGWLAGAAEAPEAALAAELAGLAEVEEPALLRTALRQAKRRVALTVALGDLGGVWTLEEVTLWLTRLANAACTAALTRLTAEAIARGRLPGLAPGDAAAGGGLAVFAMGKMGAEELNYSSDIDLICLFDETRFGQADYPEARAGFVRIVRGLAAMLSDITDEGYVFRTDLRLRPDAAVTPVAMSMAAAEMYYESLGRTWERAAWIKARVAAGDVAAGARFIEVLRPFIWRKHLDFAAIEDAHDIRLKIRAHKGLGGRLQMDGHDIKLGQGGIREIEFFTQTRQLIAGGRDERLRVRGTVEGLARLTAAGWVQEEVRARLTDHYRAHREIEHRLQMVHDAQTQALPNTQEGWERLAALCGTDAAGLRAGIKARCAEVAALTEEFFAPAAMAPPPPLPDYAAEITARWPTYPALRSPRAVEIFRRLRPDLLRALSGAAKPEEALLAFDGFLRGLPAGVQLFSLFEANPELTRLIADICATAPALAAYLSRNSAVLDAVIGGAFFAPWPGVEALTGELERALAAAPDYEAALDAARRSMKEWHFRIGVHHLRGLVDAGEAGRQYADLAEASLRALWPVALAEFARKHGAPPGRGAVALGMGSLGAGLLHSGSDLDLIVIYDAAGAEGSDGPRPLASRPYYARLTQFILTALTAPTAEGRLYEVDMRLRPSGRGGPVATALESFALYQRGEAWTWEHLALTRARPITGEAGLAGEIEALRGSIIAEKGPGPEVAKDTAEMRARIAAAKSAEGPWDAKLGPGRLQDIELAGQLAALKAGSLARGTPEQIAAGVAAGVLTEEEGAALTAGHALFWNLRATGQLLTGGVPEPDALGEGGRRLLLRACDAADMETLRARLDAGAAVAAAAIAGFLGRQGAGDEHG